MGGKGQLFVGLSTILINSKILTFSFQYASKCTMYLQTKQVIHFFQLHVSIKIFRVYTKASYQPLY